MNRYHCRSRPHHRMITEKRMMLTFSIVLLVSFMCGQAADAHKKEYILKMTMSNCTDQEHPNYFRNVEYIQYGVKLLLNTELVVNNPIRKNSKCTIAVHKCEDRTGKHCEYFLTSSYKDYCVLIRQKNQVWSPLYALAEPPMICPLQNVYKLRNGTFDVKEALKLATAMPTVYNYYWKAVMTVYEKTKPVFCTEFLVKLDQVKS